jgi:cysteine synthase
VYENRVLRRILGSKRDKVTGDWRNLHNVEFHNLYSSPSIIGMMKSRSMRLAWLVARMGRRGMHTGLGGKIGKKDLNVGGRIILRLI